MKKSKIKTSKYYMPFWSFAILISLSFCEPAKQEEVQQSMEQDIAMEQAIKDSADAVADSNQSANNTEDSLYVSDPIFERVIEIKQENFRAGKGLSYYLPVSIENKTNRRIIGVVLERNGPGLQGSIFVKKLSVNIMPMKSMKLNLSLKQLQSTEEEFRDNKSLNGNRFMHIIASEIIYSDGEIRRIINLPYGY